MTDARQAGSVQREADERALFEAEERKHSSNLNRRADGQYENPCTQSAWEGWQAGRAAMGQSYQQDAPEAKPVARVTKAPGYFDLESLIADGEWPEGVTDLYASPVVAPEAPAYAALRLQAAVANPGLVKVNTAGAAPEASATDQPSAGQDEWPLFERAARAEIGMPDEVPFVLESEWVKAALWGWIARASLTPTAPQAAERDVCAEMRALCSYCGGTGDVHSVDGEWRGRCTCPAGNQAPTTSAA